MIFVGVHEFSSRLITFSSCWHQGLNRCPMVHKSSTLPLDHGGLLQANLLMQDWVCRLGSVFFSSFFFRIFYFFFSLLSSHTFGQVQYQLFRQIFSVLFLWFLCSDRLSKSGFDLFILNTYILRKWYFVSKKILTGCEKKLIQFYCEIFLKIIVGRPRICQILEITIDQFIQPLKLLSYCNDLQYLRKCLATKYHFFWSSSILIVSSHQD